MWISKKNWQALVERIDALEEKTKKHSEIMLDNKVLGKRFANEPITKVDVTRFDLLKKLNDSYMFSQIIFYSTQEHENPESLHEFLLEKIPEEELKKINNAASRDGCQPLSFSFKQ